MSFFRWVFSSTPDTTDEGNTAGILAKKQKAFDEELERQHREKIETLRRPGSSEEDRVRAAMLERYGA
jgi:hypothetical protein